MCGVVVCMLLDLRGVILDEYGFEDWSIGRGEVFVCPHGNVIGDEQGDPEASCGCVSPLVELEIFS